VKAQKPKSATLTYAQHGGHGVHFHHHVQCLVVGASSPGQEIAYMEVKQIVKGIIRSKNHAALSHVQRGRTVIFLI